MEGKYQNIINEKPIKKIDKPNIDFVRIFSKKYNTMIHLLKMNRKIRFNIINSEGKIPKFSLSDSETPALGMNKVYLSYKEVHLMVTFGRGLINMLILVFFLVLLKNSITKV